MQSTRVPSTSAICGALLLWNAKGAPAHSREKSPRLLKIGRKTLTAHRALLEHYHPIGPDNVLPRFQSPTAHHPRVSAPLSSLFYSHPVGEALFASRSFPSPNRATT